MLARRAPSGCWPISLLTGAQAHTLQPRPLSSPLQAFLANLPPTSPSTRTLTHSSPPPPSRRHPRLSPCPIIPGARPAHLALLKCLLPPPLLSHRLRPSSNLSSSVKLSLAKQPNALSVSAELLHHLPWTPGPGPTANIAFSTNWQWLVPSYMPLGRPSSGGPSAPASAPPPMQ